MLGIDFGLLLGAFGFVCGLLMRGGVNQLTRRKEYTRGLADGILEILAQGEGPKVLPFVRRE
jgi:hypothetical protein